MEFLSLEEAASALRLSTKSMRGLLERRKIPWSKVAGRVKIEKVELEKFLVLCRVVSAEEAIAARKPGYVR